MDESGQPAGRQDNGNLRDDKRRRIDREPVIDSRSECLAPHPPFGERGRGCGGIDLRPFLRSPLTSREESSPLLEAGQLQRQDRIWIPPHLPPRTLSPKRRGGRDIRCANHQHASSIGLRHRPERHLRLNRYDAGMCRKTPLVDISSKGLSPKAHSQWMLEPIFRESRIFEQPNGARIQTFAAFPDRLATDGVFCEFRHGSNLDRSGRERQGASRR